MSVNIEIGAGLPYETIKNEAPLNEKLQSILSKKKGKSGSKTSGQLNVLHVKNL